MPSHKVIDKQASRKGKASPSNASRVSLKGAGTNGALLGDLRSALVKVAIGSRAPKMQAYMKSSMPYHGVTAPLLRIVCRELFASVRFADGDDFRDSILGIWRGARFREERYAAIELSGHRAAKAFQTLDQLELYEELIVTGAWWDYVDQLASHRVGNLLRAYPHQMKKAMLAWSKGADMWKRRTSIICQLTFKTDTDLDLLYRCIEPSLPSKEFFLRKAIGWALRQYAWTDPREVVRYVREHRSELSDLSKREALKNVLRAGTIDKIP